MKEHPQKQMCEIVSKVLCYTSQPFPFHKLFWIRDAARQGYRWYLLSKRGRRAFNKPAACEVHCFHG